jgi:Domain of unknown function (DUF397)
MGRSDLPSSSASWRKASFCAGGECVEVAASADLVFLRNSTAPHEVVRYSPREWQAFLRGVRAGEFDDLGVPNLPVTD